MNGDPPRNAESRVPSSDRLAAALNVALAWHDGAATGSAIDRATELDGCRAVLVAYMEAVDRGEA